MAKDTSKAVPSDTDTNWTAPTEGKEVQTGFPAYWNPSDGARCIGIVVAKDDYDPDFVRIYMQATRPLQCQRGPKDDAEKVIVKPGEFFSVGDYKSLNLQNFIGCEIYFEVDKKVQVKSDKKRSVWTFKNVRVVREGLELPAVNFARAALPESDTNGNMADAPIS